MRTLQMYFSTRLLVTGRQIDVITIEPYPKSISGKRITVDVNEVARNLHNEEKVSEATYVLGQAGHAYLSSGTVNLLKIALNQASSERYNEELIELRMRAVSLLGLSRNPEATPIVTDRLHNDPSWRVRDLAAKFLGELAGEAAIPDLLRARVGNWKHKDRGIGCGNANGVLVGLGDAGGKAVPILIRMLKNGIEAPSSIIESLEETGDRRAIKPLIDIIARPTSPSAPSMEHVRDTAARTLAHFSVKFTYGLTLRHRGRRLAEGIPLTPRPNRIVRESDRTRIREELEMAGYDINNILGIYPGELDYYPDEVNYYFGQLE